MEDRRFLVKGRVLETNVPDIEPIKQKYKCSTVLKRSDGRDAYLLFVDEIKDVEYDEV